MKERRRGFVSWFVEPYRQVKLGLIFVLLNLTFSLIFFCVVGYFFLDVYGSLISYFNLTADQGGQVAEKLKLPMYICFMVIASFWVSTILASAKYTHQIYGPLVSIERFLDDLIAARPFSPVEVRDGDQLKQLAAKLNKVGERVSPGYRQAPMVAIHKFLDDMMQGEVPEVLNIREGDSYHDLVLKLNKMRSIMIEKG